MQQVRRISEAETELTRKQKGVYRPKYSRTEGCEFEWRHGGVMEAEDEGKW
jgi:hypothetical protein